jgi:hypothetical protein
VHHQQAQRDQAGIPVEARAGLQGWGDANLNSIHMQAGKR